MVPKIMQDSTQISVSISNQTRERLDRISSERGIRKNHLVEQALSQFFDAIEQRPDPLRLESPMLTPEQIQRLHELLASPPPPDEQKQKNLLNYLSKAPKLGAPNPKEFLKHGTDPTTPEEG
jgi:hypothetical protein